MEKILQQIVDTVERLSRQKDTVLLAIDGNSTAGKSTLAELLEKTWDCNVFHMDDFFLRPEQRTTQRLAQPGGNVDYERFWQEVLLPLKTGKSFAYCPYDCSACTLRPPVTVTPKKINVIEGSYSHHPHFEDVYDLRVFLAVSPQRQRERILERPEFLHRRFFEEWIPMEQRYFDAFRIREKADLVLMPKENQ